MIQIASHFLYRFLAHQCIIPKTKMGKISVLKTICIYLTWFSGHRLNSTGVNCSGYIFTSFKGDQMSHLPRAYRIWMNRVSNMYLWNWISLYNQRNRCIYNLGLQWMLRPTSNDVNMFYCVFGMSLFIREVLHCIWHQ